MSTKSKEVKPTIEERDLGEDMEFLEQPDLEKQAEPPILKCDGLVKIYKTDELEVMALQGLDLEIQRGEIVAIIGKSGSGKSTLLNMIGGLEKPTVGRIYVDGNDLFAMSEKELVDYRSNTVGFVWQNSGQNLFPYLTAVQNVEAPLMLMGRSKGNTDKPALNKRAIRKKALHLLSLTGIKHKANAYPYEMSGGEQQRVAIAVALANDPKILLADEPTGAVDTKTSDMIQELFQQLNVELGITVIIVTHDMRLADRVSRVIMVSDGKIGTEKIASKDEYSVLDKARRVQLSEEMLKEAGITSNKVRVEIVDGNIVISKENPFRK